MIFFYKVLFLSFLLRSVDANQNESSLIYHSDHHNKAIKSNITAQNTPIIEKTIEEPPTIENSGQAHFNMAAFTVIAAIIIIMI